MAHNYTHRFRAVDRDIWEAIKRGAKKVETRAATPRYQKIAVGDRVALVCGKSRFIRHVRKVHHFRSVAALTKKYKLSAINPNCKTLKELNAMYLSFPGYKEKLKRYGIVAFELK
ncbi:MAG: hypothetical protein V1656_03065 [Candidatus Jorgensenbacteria bacterium]